MSKYDKVKLLKDILYITAISMLGCTAIVFTVLYVDTFDSGFFFDYSSMFTAVCVSIISIITVLAVLFFKNKYEIVYKLFFLVIATITATLICLYCLKVSGFLEKIDSVEKFRIYVESHGAFAVSIFILIQFLQVVVLPIPSFITVGAGVLLFGPFKGALFSCVGIILGSLLAFFIGKIFGVKVVEWLVGKSALKKWLKKIKGKDKIVFTFMFLFPFFPDDVLCFVAGITSMSVTFFVSMIIVVRFVTIFISSYSMNNSLIPYDTWWGIILWILFFAFTLLLTYVVCKGGDRFKKKFIKSKKH